MREDIAGWSTIDSGDNNVEIIECKIRVGTFAQAVAAANELAPLVEEHEPLDSQYTIRVNLTRWVVEIRMSVPKGFWESENQKKLAEGIAKFANS